MISFETGFTSDIVQVLLDRFAERYETILYSEDTQEITLLNSLEYSVLKGGKPVSDLLERELSQVKETGLIEATYQRMQAYWSQSKRVFDKTIRELFEKELTSRGSALIINQNETQDHNDTQTYLHSHIHNQESPPTIRHEAGDDALDRYITYIKLKHKLKETVTRDDILFVYYEKEIGPLTADVKSQLMEWQNDLPTSLIIEAIQRSMRANNPINYAKRILERWREQGVATLKDVAALDLNFSRQN